MCDVIGKDINLYAKLLECTAEAIFLQTAEGKVLDVNSAACRLLGYSKEEFLNIHIADLLTTPTDSDGNKTTNILDGSGKQFACTGISRDGREIPLEVHSHVYQQADRQFLIVFARDCTEQFRTMEQLQQQNDYMLLLHEMNIGILNGLDLEELLNKVVARGCEIFGTPDAFLYLLDKAGDVVEMKIGVGRNANLEGYKQKIGQGAAGTVALLKEPLLIENYHSWLGRDTDPKWDDLQTCVSIPFKSGDKIIGVLGLDYFDNRSFSPLEMRLFSQFAELVSIALVKANLHSMLVKSEQQLQQKNEDLTLAVEALTASEEELRQQEEELRHQLDKLMENETKINRQNMVLTLLNKTAVGLMHKQDINEVLGMIASCSNDLFGVAAQIWVIDERHNRLMLKIDLDDSVELTGSLRLGEGLAGRVALDGTPQIIENYCEWSGRVPDPCLDKVKTCACAPLKIGEKISGVIVLDFYYDRVFSLEDMHLLNQLAELASIALYNAQLVTDYKNEIQERLHTEEALRKSENRYKNLYGEFQKKQAFLVSLSNSIPDLIFFKDCYGNYLGCNTAFEELVNRKERDLIGLTAADLFSEELAQSIENTDGEVINGGEFFRFEESFFYPDGRKVLFDTLKIPFYDSKNSVSGLIGVSRDITERKRKEDEIIYLSLHDTLTGLYNRAFFEEEMKRLEGMRTIAMGLIVFDVDGLKIINDTLGHATGDLILKAVAKILKDSFRAGDLVARIGGDEFAVLVDHNSKRVIEANCRKIKEYIELYNAENPTIPISLSIGSATSKAGPVDPGALFKEADNNMYREKLHRNKSSRSAIVQTLMKALEARDFQTEGHSERMQELIASFAIALDLPEHTFADLRLLARFHDIGKVGIPDSILFKPDKLSEAELAVMRQHCEIGYRIALSAPDLTPIADWILKHQEWWNGQGYPLGISGENIPLECRMLSIVDAYDAMTSDRPYRKAVNIEAAISELKKCAGTQFDPALVEKFITLRLE